MAMPLSKLFGMEIYGVDGDYRGKVYDLIINLEKGKVETITTEPLKPKSKLEAKKILTEKSIPFRNVRSAKDIIVVGHGPNPAMEEAEPRASTRGTMPQPRPMSSYTRTRYRP